MGRGKNDGQRCVGVIEVPKSQDSQGASLLSAFHFSLGGLGCGRVYVAGHRQLRFVHLQPGAVPGRDAGGITGPPQRPHYGRAGPRARAGADPGIAGAVLAARIRAVQ